MQEKAWEEAQSGRLDTAAARMRKLTTRYMETGDLRLAPAALLAILVLLGLLWVWQQYGGGVIALTPAVSPGGSSGSCAVRHGATATSAPFSFLSFLTI